MDESSARLRFGKAGRWRYLRRAVVAHVAEVRSATRPSGTVALCPAAANSVGRRPHHLRVMANLAQIVLRPGSVLEKLMLQVPRLYGEKPVTS